jgi:hypothetical protein
MPDTAIVGFLDILGYEKIVKEHINDINLTRNIEGIFKTAVDLVKKNIPIAKEKYQVYGNKMVETYNSRIICDSAIFTMNISKILPDSHYDYNTHISNHLWLYFNAISMFYMMFTAKTGSIVRGGIALGPHYENDEDKHLFIFSQAFVDAVKLEKEQKGKDLARVTIHDNLLSYLKKISFPYTNECFDNDTDGVARFNLYLFLKAEQDFCNVLHDLKNGIIANMKYNKQYGNEKELGKLRYFVKYHNQKISECKNDLNEFLIEEI